MVYDTLKRHFDLFPIFYQWFVRFSSIVRRTLSLFEGLRDTKRGDKRVRAVLCILQWAASPSGAGLPDTGGSVLRFVRIAVYLNFRLKLS